jgi:glycerophosphoryl diester phosphodiesterase
MSTTLVPIRNTRVVPSHAFLDWPHPIPFAHRGGASDAPENTMPAFEYAVDLGFHYIETDVQVTSDGVLMAFHDSNLKRTCGIDRKIGEMTFKEVSNARVHGVAPIPKLEDLLGEWPDVRVNIDCKSNDAVQSLCAAIRRTDAIDRVCVGAFDDRRVRRISANLGPQLCTALGPAGVALLRFGIPFNPASKAAQVPVKEGPLRVVNKGFVDRAHRRGLKVHVWTIDDPSEISHLLDLGVDGIMTDRPIVLRDVLQQRGMWE